MTFNEEVRIDYFRWLYDSVCKGRSHETVSYKKLFELLHDIRFKITDESDYSRIKDGASLRYRFAILEYDERYTNCIVEVLDRTFGSTSCSVLEMIVALAIRCEETIMDDPEYGDRTGQWFWSMINNLGIGNMTDDIFDEDVVTRIIDRFMLREYEPNGKGGLFYISNCEEDLRDVEIWTQLCWYLNNIT